MCLSCFFCKEPANKADDSHQRVSSKHSADGGSSSKGRPTRIHGSREDKIRKLRQTDGSHRGNLNAWRYDEEEKEKHVDERSTQNWNNLPRDRLEICISSSSNDEICISSSSNDEEEFVTLKPCLMYPPDDDFGTISYFDPSRHRDEDVEVISERGQPCLMYPPDDDFGPISYFDPSRHRDEDVEVISERGQPCLMYPPDDDFGPITYFDPSRHRDEDVEVISERGQVACRDYVHSRHHCVKFPFKSTTHERCCPLCYCYVCDLLAPCKYWNGKSGHCHASDKEPKWTEMRTLKREFLTDNY